jgi:hypothetical protein
MTAADHVGLDQRARTMVEIRHTKRVYQARRKHLGLSCLPWPSTGTINWIRP